MSFKRIAKLQVKQVYAADKAGAYSWRNVVKAATDAGLVTQKDLPADVYNYDTQNFIYIKARAISGLEKWGPNQNGDAFEWNEIVKSYPTFIGKGIYEEHDEDSVDKAKGMILDAWPTDEQFVEVLFCIDRNQYQELVDKILSGLINTVSMSCLASEAECSVCGNVAHSESDICDHMRMFDGPFNPNDPDNILRARNPFYCKNSLDPHGNKAYEINRDFVFIGLSAVADPADKDAFIKEVKASKEKMDATRIELNRYIEAKAKVQASKKNKKVKHLKAAEDVKKLLKASSDMAKNHLKWLVYQVNNGGVSQYCGNGYADELLDYVKTHDIVKELQEMGCPEQGVKAMSKIISLLENNTPMYECGDCNGSGEWEEEDENGDIETTVCSSCHGDGFVETDKWANADNRFWMEEFEDWFYKLDMDFLDDWTGQSHNHSHAMDMIQENKKQASKVSKGGKFKDLQISKEEGTLTKEEKEKLKPFEDAIEEDYKKHDAGCKCKACMKKAAAKKVLAKRAIQAARTRRHFDYLISQIYK